MSEAVLEARHIAVEGPIGIGKTSLVELLASRFEGVKVLEDVQNPFLEPFYRGKSGAAFHRGDGRADADASGWSMGVATERSRPPSECPCRADHACESLLPRPE